MTDTSASRKRGVDPADMSPFFYPPIIEVSPLNMCQLCTWVPRKGYWELKYKSSLCEQHLHI